MRRKIRAAKLQAILDGNPGFFVLWDEKEAQEPSNDDCVICGGQITESGDIVFTLTSRQTRTMAADSLIEIEWAVLDEE